MEVGGVRPREKPRMRNSWLIRVRSDMKVIWA